MDVDWIFPITRKGKYWREGRRLLERSFRPGETDSHWRMIEDNTRVFLGQVLATPHAFRKHIDLCVFAATFVPLCDKLLTRLDI